MLHIPGMFFDVFLKAAIIIHIHYLLNLTSWPAECCMDWGFVVCELRFINH